MNGPRRGSVLREIVLEPDVQFPISVHPNAVYTRSAPHRREPWFNSHDGILTFGSPASVSKRPHSVHFDHRRQYREYRPHHTGADPPQSSQPCALGPPGGPLL